MTELWTLPRQYFASEAIYQEEMERIFCQHWLHVGRSEQITETGQYFLVNIGETGVIVVRDQAGMIRAFHNVCRHRGTRLCSQEQGRFHKSIQCPYHAWTYALDGRLIGVPSIQRMLDFNPANFPLYTVAADVWEGSIFINLSAEPEPVAATFGDHLTFFHPWQIGELVTVASIDYDVKANWKIIVQNFSECYHCPVVHPEYNRLSHFESGHNVFNGDQFFGGTMHITQPGGGISTSGKMCAPPLKGITGKNLQQAHFYHLFPNLLLILAPDHVVLYTLSPQAPNRTLIHCDFLFHVDAVAMPGFDAGDTIEIWDITNRQDWPMCEETQLGVQSRAYKSGPYYEWQDNLGGI